MNNTINYLSNFFQKEVYRFIGFNLIEYQIKFNQEIN
jgi:hypothetical protein